MNIFNNNSNILNKNKLNTIFKIFGKNKILEFF